VQNRVPDVDPTRRESSLGCRAAVTNEVYRAMKYMMMIAGEERGREGLGAEDLKAAYDTVDEWWNAHVAAGRIVAGHQLEPAATATTVRTAPGAKASITDGPFVEGKEMVGGYAILDVPDLDGAIAVATSWPLEAALELRPVIRRHEG
jgi:hypothetical protein